jgi:NAD(P)-dependent dehydrogenase (short-subunit alcohol dehydrogenase family)
MRLNGRVAIVTGGAQGIGAAILRRFAAEGAAVLAVDILEDKAASIAAELRKAGARASSVARVVDFLSLDRSEFEHVLSINLTAPFQLGPACARHMTGRGHGGSIVNVSSVSAVLANPGQTAYCASKAGLEGLTREMAVSLAPHGIRVNVLAPGPTWTGMASEHPQYFDPILARTPLGRFASADEMASAALFLASDDSSFMTGESMRVDGGRCALNYTMPARRSGGN